MQEISGEFYKHEFEGYIEQKNYVVRQTTHPYILALDADEALSEDLKQSVKEAKIVGSMMPIS